MSAKWRPFCLGLNELTLWPLGDLNEMWITNFQAEQLLIDGWPGWGISSADSRFAPSQWETSLQGNAVSHWLGANLESALYLLWNRPPVMATDSLDLTDVN